VTSLTVPGGALWETGRVLLRRCAALPPIVLAAVLGLTGCSGEAGPVDDGTYSALQAGAPDALDALGVDLVSLERPAAAAPGDVVAALEAESLDAETYSVGTVDGLTLDPERVGGLLGLAGAADPADGGHYVVLSFDGVDAAVLFAQGDAEIFDDAEAESSRSAYFSGNLVGYYAPGEGDDTSDRFRAALTALSD